MISTPAAGAGNDSAETNHQPAADTNTEETNGTPYQTQGNNITPNTIGRRHQLYVGNLTWVSITSQPLCNFDMFF